MKEIFQKDRTSEIISMQIEKKISQKRKKNNKFSSSEKINKTRDFV